MVQYKFNVDGEWRHDEQQPFVNGSYGVVNTIFLTREDILPSIFMAETPGRSHMEVDNVVYGNVVSSFPSCLLVLMLYCIYDSIIVLKLGPYFSVGSGNIYACLRV